MTVPVLELSGVSKDYHALRPLRIERLSIGDRDHVAIVGVDQPSAEVFVHLVTGATLPDRGEIVVAGRTTASVTDAAEWLTLADTFGIVGERAVLLDMYSGLQNLAVPFSLEIDPIAADVREQAVQLAREVGLPESEWDGPIGALPPASRLRLRLGRALALKPRVILLEHASAELARGEVASLGREIREICERRATASLALTADTEFASAVADRVLTLEPATGRLAEARRFGWFGRRRG